MNDDIWVCQAAMVAAVVILVPLYWWNNVSIRWETKSGWWKKDHRQFFFHREQT